MSHPMASWNPAKSHLKAGIQAAKQKSRQGLDLTGKGIPAAGRVMATAGETMATVGHTVTSTGGVVAQKVNETVKASLVGGAIATAGGSLVASLSKWNDLPLNLGDLPLNSLPTRIRSAVGNYGIDKADAIARLPGELEKYGTDAVNNFLNKGHGDVNGKHWSHIKSQKNHSELVSEASNAIWEDGSTNMSRGANDMTWQERLHASFDNHVDGLFAAAQTAEFWQRTLGNALEAGAYAAAIAAVDQLLIHRDVLTNGTDEQRKATLLSILRTSGLLATGALPVSVFMAVALMLIPSLTVVMGPLGVIGTAGLGIRLVTSVVNNPTQQEREVIRNVQGYLEQLPLPSLTKAAKGKRLARSWS